MNIYKRGTEWLCAASVMKPLGKRVILKAILAEDASEIFAGKTDTRKAVCHVVTDIGPDVQKVKPGEMVIHLSTATDAVDFDKVDGRYTLCHEDDIATHWDHEVAVEAHQRAFPELYP